MQTQTQNNNKSSQMSLFIHLGISTPKPSTPMSTSTPTVTTTDTTIPTPTPTPTPLPTPKTTPASTTVASTTEAETTTEIITTPEPATTPVPPTLPPANPEILFLVDTSSSVSSKAYESQKDYVKQLGKYLGIAPDSRKAAVIAYGALSVVSIPFDGYQTYDEFSGAVDKMRGVGGPRRLDLALDKASETLKKGEPSAPKIVILLITGMQAQGVKSLSEAVQPLHDLKAKTYVVAIGGEPSTRDLRPLVNQLKDIFRVPTPTELTNDVDRVGATVEEGEPYFRYTLFCPFTAMFLCPN